MAGGIQIVQMIVPMVVISGSNVTLICEHKTEGDILYSVKWYKGYKEFFRFTPNEIPSIKLFHLSGLDVDESLTNSTQLVLINVTPKLSGKYSCEVSADEPSFQTQILAGNMDVVVIPTGEPVISDIKPFYAIGDYLKSNCTLNGSISSALLEWKINNVPPHLSDIIKYNVTKKNVTRLPSRTIGLNLKLTQKHFIESKLKIQCIGRIQGLYYGETEKIIGQDHQHVYSPSLSYLNDEVNQKSAGNAAATVAASITNRLKTITTKKLQNKFYIFLFVTIVISYLIS